MCPGATLLRMTSEKQISAEDAEDAADGGANQARQADQAQPPFEQDDRQADDRAHYRHPACEGRLKGSIR